MDDKLCNALHRRDIEWVFHPPTASHMDGVWVRQLHSLWMRQHQIKPCCNLPIAEWAMLSLLPSPTYQETGGVLIESSRYSLVLMTSSERSGYILPLGI